MPDLPADAITAEMLAAAHAYDLAHRPKGWSWTRPSDAQVVRLLTGAAPALRAQGAAAERERLLAALTEQRAVLAYPGSGRLTDAIIWKDVADLLDGDADGC